MEDEITERKTERGPAVAEHAMENARDALQGTESKFTSMGVEMSTM